MSAISAAEAMAAAAGHWLELLDDSQRQQAVAGFPGEPERSRWFYTPTDHGGLALADCTPAQRQAALRLLATGLSPSGYNLAAAVMGHELILERFEDWPVLEARDDQGNGLRPGLSTRRAGAAGGSGRAARS